ncbi:MAG: hypothetical protein ACO1QS_14960 [Verrucomicrobiota bacterium]
MSKIDAIRSEYGEFLSESSMVDFDENEVPESLRPLIPYASFWGLADDWEREKLAEKAPAHLKISLRKMIADNDDALDDWLAGVEASSSNPSSAYIAFSAMRMAADYM